MNKNIIELSDAFLPEIISFYEIDGGKQISEDWKKNNVIKQSLDKT